MKRPATCLAIMVGIMVLPPAVRAAPAPEGEITLLAPAARCGLGQAPAAPRPSRVLAAPAEEEEPPARLQRALYLCVVPGVVPQRTGGWIATGPRRAL